jgi:hypothetical protein
VVPSGQSIEYHHEQVEVDKAERVLFAAWERIASRLGDRSIDGLVRPERMFAAIWMLEAEVNNGGFHQWMFNSTGDDAELAVAALREIGAARAASVCERFFALLPGGRPLAERNARQAQLDAAVAAIGEDAFTEACGPLEEEFQALEDDLRHRLLVFIRANWPRE